MITHPILSDSAQHGVRLGVRHMEAFLEWMGSPHTAAPVVHVAGTNGKGSTVRFVSAMLQAAGLRVGAFTSPHLQRVNERIRVNGVEIPDAALDDLLVRLDGARQRWATELLSDERPADQVLTYFELMTAAAFVHFQERAVDIVVIEVGLGGRLDATNVVSPAVAVVVTVGMDHQDRLGPDLPSIASEKAGIVKPGVPAVAGDLPPPAMRVVRAIAHEHEAPLSVFNQDYRVSPGRGRTFSFTGFGRTLTDLEITLRGHHQVHNAGVAIAAVLQLPPEVRPGDEAIRQGLAVAQNPGRLEWLAGDLLVDCAHNGDGAASVAAFLKTLPEAQRPDTLLLGMSQDKDARSLVVGLAPCVRRVLTTHCKHPRSTSAGDLAASLVGVDIPVLPAGPVEDALMVARDGGHRVLVAGSVFLVGAVRDLVGAP